MTIEMVEPTWWHPTGCWCPCCSAHQGCISSTTGQFEYMPDPYRPPYKPKHAKRGVDPRVEAIRMDATFGD